MSQYDTAGLHEFLIHTPEGGLRKMLVDKNPMTDVHFNLLMKVAKGCNAEEFGEHLEKKTFPKVRLGPAEMKLKEKFWDECMKACQSRGILQPKVATKAVPTEKVAA
jgi:hypothetical protein